MERKKLLFLSSFIALLLIPVAFLASNINSSSVYKTKGNDSEYVLRLDLENDFTDDGIAYTGDGNPITFSFENIETDDRGFVFKNGFKLTNTTPLRGMTSLYFDRQISWKVRTNSGWDCPRQFESKWRYDYYEGSFIGTTIYDNPSFFTIEDIGNKGFKVDYLEFRFSCSYYSAPESYTSNLLFSLKQDNTYELIGLMDRTVSTADIPVYHKGKKVTSIASGALSGCSYLNHLYLPFIGEKDTNQVYPFGYIFGQSTFTNSKPVVQKYYPEGEYITSDITYQLPNTSMSLFVYGGGFVYGAFYNCSSLYHLTLGDNCRINYLSGNSLCYGCTNLLSATLPSSTTYLPTSCFTNCSLLTFTIPSGIVTIGTSAFAGCTNIAKIITIPRTVTTISNSAFSGCSNIQTIKIPNTVTSIGSRAFLNCSSLYIYCEAQSKPDGWNDNWNPSSRPVYWGIEF